MGKRIIGRGLLLFIFSCMPQAKVTPDQLNLQFAKANAAYEELMSYNPAEAQTYNYRNLMTQADQAKANGKLEDALSFATKAEEQARLTIQLIQGVMAKDREKLDSAKGQLEEMFPVNRNLVRKYWELDGRLKNKQVKELDADVENLLKAIEQEKRMTLIEARSLTVSAPQEYIKQWGNVRIYQEITPEGKLKGVVDTVAPGAKIKVVKIRLFSPGTTFYFVETNLGVQGWMAERYLLGEEAEF